MRARVLELENYFDEEVGPAARRFGYGTLMRVPGRAAKAFFGRFGFPWSLATPVLGPPLERVLRRQLRIDDSTILASQGVVLAALDRIDTLIAADPARYLVGDRFTLADLTAASLLAPLVAPPKSPYHGPSLGPEVEEARAAIRGRPSWHWVERIYRDHR
jgi:glutathione S-transferase